MRTNVLRHDTTHVLYFAKLHTFYIAIALKCQVIALLLYDAMQNVMPRGNLCKDGIADIIAVALFEEDAVASMLDERTHTVTFDENGVWLALVQHL